jgi:hypothetical protein
MYFCEVLAMSLHEKLNKMKAIEMKKGMLVKNNKGNLSEVIYCSKKRNSVILKDGSRYGYDFAVSLQK